jgi:hypothetical protein
MTLRRTRSGLLSLHRFHNVDVVVICEGGPQVSLQDVLAGSGTDGTVDALYWRMVVGLLNLRERFHFKAVGGKENLRSIAVDIQEAGITTVTVCFDRDYDHLLGRSIAGERVAYTQGYSWESDVLSGDVLCDLLQMLCGGDGQCQAACGEARLALKAFSQAIARWCDVDIALASKREGSVLDRARPLRSLAMTASPPVLNEPALETRLGELGYKRGPRKISFTEPDKALQVCFGKLVAKYCYHLFKHLLSHLVDLRIEYEVFMRLMITRTKAALEAGGLSDFRDHLLMQRNAFA